MKKLILSLLLVAGAAAGEVPPRVEGLAKDAFLASTEVAAEKDELKAEFPVAREPEAVLLKESCGAAGCSRSLLVIQRLSWGTPVNDHTVHVAALVEIRPGPNGTHRTEVRPVVAEDYRLR